MFFSEVPDDATEVFSEVSFCLAEFSFVEFFNSPDELSFELFFSLEDEVSLAAIFELSVLISFSLETDSTAFLSPLFLNERSLSALSTSGRGGTRVFVCT